MIVRGGLCVGCQKSLVEFIITGLVVLYKIGKVVFITEHLSRHHTYESCTQ